MKLLTVLSVFLLLIPAAIATCVDLNDPSTWGDKIDDWGNNVYEIKQSTTLCPGTYNLDTGKLVISNYDRVLDCNGATLVGAGPIMGGSSLVYVGRITSWYTTYPPRITVKNCIMVNCSGGISVAKARSNQILNNEVRDCYGGIRLTGASENVIANNTLLGNQIGLSITSYQYSVNSGENLFESNLVANSTEYGFYAMYVHNNTVRDNYFLDSASRGMYLQSAEDFQIYNNYLDNNDNIRVYSTNNIYFDRSIVTKRNIAGGPSIGGNYWSDYTGADDDNDMFGDTAYTNSAMGVFSDYLPLIKKAPPTMANIGVQSDIIMEGPVLDSDEEDSGKGLGWFQLPETKGPKKGLFQELWNAFRGDKEKDDEGSVKDDMAEARKAHVAAMTPPGQSVAPPKQSDDCECDCPDCDYASYKARITELLAKIRKLEGRCEETEEEDLLPAYRTCSRNSDCGRDEFCMVDGCGSRGKCGERPDACPDIWSPVCGCDGETYGSTCAANRAGVNVKSRVACKEDGPDGTVSVTKCKTSRDCEDGEFCEFDVEECGGTGVCTGKPDACAGIWNPVCGCDGETYASACTARSAGASIAYKEECKEDEQKTLTAAPAESVKNSTLKTTLKIPTTYIKK